MKNDPHSGAAWATRMSDGHEARAGDGDHAALKLWLRLLACTTQIEAEIRAPAARAVRHHAGALRLHGAARPLRPTALKMRELSRCLMVTGGNVTGLTDELERDGLVVREAAPATGAPGSCA